jgi:uncharacterized OB-fold protein
MALINCPECGTEVSDKADKCPKCAYPINSERVTSKREPDIKTQTIVKSREGCFLQTLNAGCMIIAIVIGLIFLIAFFV